MRATRFSVAVHMLLLMARAETPPRSADLAAAANAHPVAIRRLVGRLQRGGLAVAHQGRAGIALRRAPDKVTLRDIWLAVADESEGPVVMCHPNPDPDCPVGRHIPTLIEELGVEVEEAVLAVLARTTLADLMRRVA